MQLVIRADAGPEIGVGHVMRMAALGACAVQNGCAVTLAYLHCPPSLVERLTALGITTKELDRQKEIENLRSLLSVEAKSQSVLVLDGYQFDEKYQQNVSGLAGQLAIMDDYAHLSSYQADLIINQNPGAQNFAAMYRDKAPEARLLLGPQYVLLRPEFRRLAQHKRDFGECRRFLISLGGSDQENASRLLLDGLLEALGKNSPDSEITVVLGAANPNKDAWQNWLQERLARDEKPLVNILYDVKDMASLLDSMQVVLTAGGTTVLESAYLGLACFVLVTAQNQMGVLHFAQAGEEAVHYLGKLEEIDESSVSRQLQDNLNTAKLEQLSANARRQIDGQGVTKILAALGLQSVLELG